MPPLPASPQAVLSYILQGDPSLATRQVQWNVTSGMLWYMYLSMLAALGVFAWGCWLRLRLWRVGKPEMRWDQTLARLQRMLVYAGAQRSVVRQRAAGMIHAAIYFGVLASFAATVVVMIDHDLGVHVMHGRFYLYGQSLLVNVLAAAALVGLGAAAVRRFLIRPPQLERGRMADAAILATLFLIMLTGFLISGIRIAVTEDPWGSWRPFSELAGAAAVALWPEPDSMRLAHQWLWVGHVALWHTSLALIPFTKMFHLVSSSANIFLAPLDGKSRIPRIAFEDDAAIETLGIRTPFDMTWKQLLDLDACTECGRCEAACPAWANGQPLSPKRVIIDLRDNLRGRAAGLHAAHEARRRGDDAAFESFLAKEPALAGDVIPAEALWACTTCRACEAACPVSIEHVRLIVQLRQNLVMEQGHAPSGVPEMVGSLDARQHPFYGASVDRAAWYAAGAVGGGAPDTAARSDRP